MATAKLFLDKSFTNKEDEHPIRIQIYHAGKQDKFTTKIFASPTAYEGAHAVKPHNKYLQQLKKKIEEARVKAESTCEKLGGAYTREKFKRMYYSEIDYTTKGQRLEIKSLYTDYMKLLEDHGNSFKTISYHNSAMKCFLLYHPGLCLQDVTVEWLNKFEKYMLSRDKSLTAVGSYVRSLRTIYNKAVDDGLIGRENWPFGPRKYKIAAAVSAKAFLTPLEVKGLKEFKPANEAQQRALDFWFFCYYTNGIAPVDAVQLTQNNIRGNHIIFERQKTKKSNTEAKQIVAHMHQDVPGILKRQGNKDKKNPYLFNVLKPGLSGKEKVEAIDTWKRLTNRVLNRIGEKLKLHTPLNLYCARHSWATVMKINNVSVADISDGLGHSSLVQTNNYLGSIVTDKVKTMSDLL